MKYSDIRNTLNTGDLVLFSGKGTFSNIIKYATFSKHSHVGMILNIPEYDFICIWESTTLSNIDDLNSLKPRKGVQLVPLSERVQKYNGEIYIRRLTGPKLPSNSLNDLMQLRKEFRGKEYELDKIELFRSAYDGLGGKNKEDLSSIFCSELVAEAYQRLKILTERKPSNEYTPANFSEKKGLLLENGYSLSPEIKITDE